MSFNTNTAQREERKKGMREWNAIYRCRPNTPKRKNQSVPRWEEQQQDQAWGVEDLQTLQAQHNSMEEDRPYIHGHKLLHIEEVEERVHSMPLNQQVRADERS
jgi:hypothetical protein